MSEFLSAVKRPWVKRLVACLFAGFVLALMIGKQQGTISGDFGVAFRHAVLSPRIVIFLAIGVILFLLISFWPLVVPFLNRPGVVPLSAGALTVLIAQSVMNWYDPLNPGGNKSEKFNAVRSAVDKTSGLQQTTTWFFDWLGWTLLLACIVVCGTAIISRLRVLGYVTAVLGVAGAVLAYLAHHDVVAIGGGPDHSLGVYANVIGFGVLAGAGLTAALSRRDSGDTREFVARVADFRPGLPYVVIGLVVGLLAFTTDAWYAPTTVNANFHAAHSAFSGSGVSSLASQYLAWLGWVSFVVALVLAAAATWLRHRVLALAAVLIGIAAIVITFFVLKSMTDVAAQVAPAQGSRWKNLGAGGFMACIAFALFAGGSLQAATAARLSVAPPPADLLPRSGDLPVQSMVKRIRTSSNTRALVIIGVALALFYPPTLTVTWQNVIVSQIGVFVLLAVGLNVVVGWAGLLDLGYIAFYEIGAYTTAYLVGALPRKPPSWLHMTPLLAIPFAIIACLIAGILLGAPTLRLRGDYLAIVTLGFGEIIQILAVNNPGKFTGGPVGPDVPHPKLNLGGLHITWGQDNLPYWYLLLTMLVIVVVLFYRLEGSRLGRAWAAIREDEVAAQASGVNTMRVKLLAFAIGASTSAFSGWFFATQVGYFDPGLFTLQASILIVAYVVFGGMGSLQGAMAGAAVLTWLPQFLKDQVPQNDRQMWIGAAVLAMMIFRPAGLLPAKRRRAELEGLDSPASSEVSAVPASEGL